MTASTTDFRVDLEASIEVKSQSTARRTSKGMSRSCRMAMCQLRAALIRVTGAIPRGAMTAAKAWLILAESSMASTVAGVALPGGR
jgi:hypothetical protein